MIQEAITNILERAFKFHLISKLKREEIFVQIKVTDVCALDPTKFSTFDGFHSLDVTKYFTNISSTFVSYADILSAIKTIQHLQILS